MLTVCLRPFPFFCFGLVGGSCVSQVRCVLLVARKSDKGKTGESSINSCTQPSCSWRGDGERERERERTNRRHTIYLFIALSTPGHSIPVPCIPRYAARV